MPTYSYLGIYFMGHPAAIERISYMLCSPKVRFTPELDSEQLDRDLSEAERDYLQKFIEKGGANIFRNVINRQKYVPVTRADLATFIYGTKNLYAEIQKPWTFDKVKFPNFLGLCIGDQGEYEKIVEPGVLWVPIDHGLFSVSYGDPIFETLPEDQERNGYDRLLLNPPACVKFEQLSHPTTEGEVQEILHVKFRWADDDPLMPLTYLSRVASRYGINLLISTEDQDGTVMWFYATGSVVRSIDADQNSMVELQRNGLSIALCREVFKIGPDPSSFSDDYLFSYPQERDDPIEQAIRHFEQKRD